MQITPTLTTLEKLAELRRLREASGRPWPGDEAMLVSILARGMVDELDDERFIRRVTEPGEFAEAPAGRFGMLREQAV